MTLHDCDVTFHALQKWYKSVFESYGWIVLMARKHPNSLKVLAFFEGAQRLYTKLCCYKRSTQNYDKKRDLAVMKRNLQILIWG
jgi:hypothetical protein